MRRLDAVHVHEALKSAEDCGATSRSRSCLPICRLPLPCLEQELGHEEAGSAGPEVGELFEAEEALGLVELAGSAVALVGMGFAECLDGQHARATSDEISLDFAQERVADALAMPRALHGHEVDLRRLGEALLDEDDADLLTGRGDGEVVRELVGGGDVSLGGFGTAEPLGQVRQNRSDGVSVARRVPFDP